MDHIPPHVAIRLKHLFPRISKTQVAPFFFDDTDMQCADLCWFLLRYPMQMTDGDRQRLVAGESAFNAAQAELEAIMVADYQAPTYLGLREGQLVRPYQAQAVEIARRSRVLLLGDDLGLGKTYSATALCLVPGALPAAVVVQTHLQGQWEEKITTFTNLRVHKIKKASPYNLPPADIYIFRYSQLAGWIARALRERRCASQCRTSSSYAGLPMSSVSSASPDTNTGSTPTWASVFAEQYQSRSWPPGPHPRRSYSPMLTSR